MVPYLILLLAHQGSLTPPTSAIDVKADGSLVLAGQGANLIILQKPTGSMSWTVRVLALGKSPSRITQIRLSPNGSKAAVALGIPGVEGSLLLLDPTKGSPIGPQITAKHKDLITALAWSADEKRIATGGYDRTILVHTLGSNTLPGKIVDHSDVVTSIEFLPQNRLASTSYDRSVKLFDDQTLVRLQTLADATDWGLFIAVRPSDGLLASVGNDKLIRLYQRGPDKSYSLLKSSFAHSAPILQARFSPDGNTLVTLGEDKFIKRFSLPQLNQVGEPIFFEGMPTRFALSGDGKKAWVSDHLGRVREVLFDSPKSQMGLWPETQPTARIDKKELSPIRPGTPALLTLHGSDLQSVRISSSIAGLIILPKIATDSVASFEIQAPPSLGGTNPLITIQSGTKTVNTFHAEVDRFARTADDLLRPEQILQGVTVHGLLDKAGQVRVIMLPLKMGTPLGAEVLGTAGKPPKEAGWEPELELRRPDGSLLERGFGKIGTIADTEGLHTLSLRDHQWRGSAGFSYRMDIGPVPVVLGVFPRVVGQSKDPISVGLIGIHLPKVPVVLSPPLTLSQTKPIDLSALPIRAAGKTEVLVSAGGETTDPSKILEPGMAGQSILSGPSKEVRWSFIAKKGQPLFLEAQATRFGSALDPTLSILDPMGRPLIRARLQSVAKTHVTFRDHNSSTPGIRLDTWGDLATHDFMLAGNDLMRIRNLPKNPDDNCVFTSRKGVRVGFLGTTPAHQPNGQDMFKVLIHPPGTKLAPNGMPMVEMPWFNDDGDADFPQDSLLQFDPPADGTYIARITDARGTTGLGHFVRLVVRKPKPDFTLKAVASGKWVEGNSQLVQVTATRLDGFSGPIELTWKDAKGFLTPKGRLGPLDDETILPIFSPTNPGQPPTLSLMGKSTGPEGVFYREATLTLDKIQKGYGLSIKPAGASISIRPGSTTKFSFEIQRPKGFEGRIPIEVKGLPHGVQVLDVGLNGILMIPGVIKRTVEIACEEWVLPGEVPFVVTARQEGKDEVPSTPVILKIGTAPTPTANPPT